MTQPTTIKMTLPCCPYCGGTSFARLRTTHVSATTVTMDSGVGIGIGIGLALALLVCTRCGKTDLFAEKLPAYLARVPHDILDASTDGPYR
jgi:hypothetical protein